MAEKGGQLDRSNSKYGPVYHWLPVAVLQNDIVVQHTALVARVDVQKCFFVSRVALEQDVVTDDGLHWTQHDYSPASLCRLDAVTQHLKPKDNANTFTIFFWTGGVRQITVKCVAFIQLAFTSALLET